MPASDQHLDQDEVFDILSSARRRYAISILSRQDGALELATLAAEIAALETDTAVEELGKQQRKRVYVSLYQTHIPKLADAGIVTYDSEARAVELVSDASDIERYFDGSAGGVRWHRYYLGFSVGTGLVLLPVIADVGPLTVVPDLLAAVLATAGIAAIAVAQYVSE